jgi:PPM family protein phosphatase
MATKLSTAVNTSLVGAADSSAGELRENNEDRFYCNADRGIFIVIDGVGGQVGGEAAAEIALKLVTKRLERATGDAESRVREAITLANNEIYRQAQANPDLRGMACVLTVALVEDRLVTIGHVGDTRLYELVEHRIEKITRDHSPVGEREDAGLITEIEAMRHPQRNEVYRDVGSEEHQPDDPGFIELIQRPLMTGSALLLCSDGLTDLLTSGEILSIADGYIGSPTKIVQCLIEAANAAGGKDNITVIYATSDQRESNHDHSDGIAATWMTSAEAPNIDYSSPETKRLSLAALRQLNNRWLFFLYGALVVAAILGSWRILPKWPASQVAEQPAIRKSRTFVVDPRDKGAFSSITQALNQTTSGDTVEVAPGEYDELLNLPEGVTVISRDFRQAVVRVPVSIETGARVAVTASGIRHGRFIGFRLEGDKEHPLEIGVRVVNASVEIGDNEVTGSLTAAIDVSNATGSVILRANLIRENDGIGVLVREGSPLLIHNVIFSNSKRPSSYSLKIEQVAQPQLVGNTILNDGSLRDLRPNQQEQLRERNVLVDKPPTGFHN